MAPRKRSGSRRNWPDHLHERNGYYSWRDPLTGREHGLGRVRAEAFAQAVEANLYLAGLRERPRLIARVTGADKHTFAAWLDRFEEVLGQREMAANTRRSARSNLARVRRDFDTKLAVRDITPMMVTDVCRSIEADGKARQAQAFRSFLKGCFQEAISAGWIDHNPVRATRLAPVKVKRARLTLEVFRQLWALDLVPWMRIAIALAAVSAQRREDVCSAQFADFHDGGWWLKQHKTGNRMVLPLELRLEVLDLSLGDVLAMARKTGVVSRYLVHQVRPYGNSPVGSQIWRDTLSRRFSDHVAELDLDWQGKNPPTFHEIRSLSERLYSLQGDVRTQELLGHRDARMTAVYHDVRGAEWVRVKVEK